MRWVAILVGGRVVHFDAPTERDVARLIGWAEYGPTEEVLSAADYAIREEERKALARNHRLKVQDSEADAEC